MPCPNKAAVPCPQILKLPRGERDAREGGVGSGDCSGWLGSAGRRGFAGREEPRSNFFFLTVSPPKRRRFWGIDHSFFFDQAALIFGAGHDSFIWTTH